jgi:hypothetical protein
VSSSTPEARLAEIALARQRVIDQEQVCKGRREKKKKASAALSEAEAELRNLEQTLVDVIDDRPAGPLFPHDGDAGAGEGPIRAPDEVDRAIAGADVEGSETESDDPAAAAESETVNRHGGKKRRRVDQVAAKRGAK